MKITILGTGRIGGTLGQKWANAGHSIIYGVRDPEGKRAAVKFDDDGVQVGFETIGTAIAKGEVIVVAIPGSAVAEMVAEHGHAMEGKIVIDASNNMQAPKMHALDTIAEAAPGAKLFRAFNSLGWENFAQPIFDGLPADLFYCGVEAAEALAVVENLITDVGMRPVRVGGLEKVDIVEGVTRLWFALAQQRGRHLAFKMLIGAGA